MAQELKTLLFQVLRRDCDARSAMVATAPATPGPRSRPIANAGTNERVTELLPNRSVGFFSSAMIAPASSTSSSQCGSATPIARSGPMRKNTIVARFTATVAATQAPSTTAVGGDPALGKGDAEEGRGGIASPVG